MNTTSSRSAGGDACWRHALTNRRTVSAVRIQWYMRTVGLMHQPARRFPARGNGTPTLLIHRLENSIRPGHIVHARVLPLHHAGPSDSPYVVKDLYVLLRRKHITHFMR